MQNLALHVDIINAYAYIILISLITVTLVHVTEHALYPSTSTVSAYATFVTVLVPFAIGHVSVNNALLCTVCLLLIRPETDRIAYTGSRPISFF